MARSVTAHTLCPAFDGTGQRRGALPARSPPPPVRRNGQDILHAADEARVHGARGVRTPAAAPASPAPCAPCRAAVRPRRRLLSASAARTRSGRGSGCRACRTSRGACSTPYMTGAWRWYATLPPPWRRTTSEDGHGTHGSKPGTTRHTPGSRQRTTAGIFSPRQANHIWKRRKGNCNTGYWRDTSPCWPSPEGWPPSCSTSAHG